MSATRWHRRFYESTRGRIIGLLRHDSRTVEELARELGVTDNAVRPHLAALERDGLVAQTGVRRGVSKPAYVYELTPDAERLFPKALGTVLSQLLDVLGDRFDSNEVERTLRETGRRLAAGRGVQPRADLDQHVRGAVQALADLGGSAQLERHGGRYVIRGFDCPLREVVTDHPQACFLAEALLQELVGTNVRQRCQQGATPRCCFEISANGRRRRGAAAQPPPAEGAPARPRRRR